jgi:hypothetical protein
MDGGRSRAVTTRTAGTAAAAAAFVQSVMCWYRMQANTRSSVMYASHPATKRTVITGTVLVLQSNKWLHTYMLK